ncbi:uncharacterized protein [Branchiostoma lanceolatum]|uniref:uncharacterized protein n=1 Tax=Branchiostoma lanceolatum TaxID=7740 RepID=UPI0034513A2F
MVKALSTSQPSLDAAIEAEEQFEEEEDTTEKDGAGKGRKKSSQEKGPTGKISAKEGRVIRELVSILFDKSDDVSIVKLQQEAKKISQRQEYQDPGKLASFLQKHDFFQTRLNKDGVMLVKVKRDVTLCGKYTASACKEDGCPHFHLCRNYASGQGCSHGLSCQFSHNLKDDHNVVVLQENFLDGLAEAQVLSMIVQPGKSKGGSKPAKNPKKDEGKPSIDVPPPMTRQQELKCLPRVCHFYSSDGKSCKNGPACTAGLHVCKFYLTGSCSRKPCKLSHNIFDPQPKDLLKKSGLMGKPGKYIIGLCKEKFEAKKKEKKEKQQAPPTEQEKQQVPPTEEEKEKQQAPPTEEERKTTGDELPQPETSTERTHDDVTTIPEPSTEWTHDDVTTIPEHWVPMGRPEGGFVPLENDIAIVEVPPSGQEVSDVMSAFHQTLNNTRIHSIKRVQNFHLWDLYCKKRIQMKRQNNNKFPRELRLFHGTNQEAVSPICNQNFDWRLSGGNVGQLFEQGSYFTVNASFASAYSQPSYPSGRRYMFFAKVLVGRYAKGDRSFCRPPPLSEADPYGYRYDSCVDDVNNPSVFVVFEPSQCYPEYLIEYSY